MIFELNRELPPSMFNQRLLLHTVLHPSPLALLNLIPLLSSCLGDLQSFETQLALERREWRQKTLFDWRISIAIRDKAYPPASRISRSTVTEVRTLLLVAYTIFYNCFLFQCPFYDRERQDPL